MRLPSAPLVEVVFELRWKVVDLQPKGQPRFGYDPAYAAFSAKFEKKMAEIGLTSKQIMYGGGPSLAYSVVDRFRKSNGSPYPLFQIGHGIAACNISTDYDWENFSKQIDTLIEAVYSSYPKTDIWEFEPICLELRYIDIFNESLLTHRSFLKFIEKDTNISLNGYSFFESERFLGEDRGVLRIRRNLVDEALGYFQVEIGTGAAGGESGIVVTSKVVKSDGFEGEWATAGKVQTLDWTTKAHNITSDFFRWLVSDSLMRSFEAEKEDLS